MKRLKLSLLQRITHYSMVFLSLISVLIQLFYVIEDVLGFYKGKLEIENMYSSIIIMLICTLLLYVIQYRRLNFKRFDITFSEEQFKEAVSRTKKELEWKIMKNNKKILLASRDDLFGSLLGELITIIKGDRYILINSICDPNKWTNIFSINRNKENVNIFLRNLNDTINEVPEVPKIEVTENEWSLKRMLVRIVLYPVCLIFIFLGIVMIYQHISFRNLTAGIGLIILCVIVLFVDIKLWIRFKKNKKI